METKVKAIILSVESNPYEFDGKSGVSHRIRISVNGEVYPVRSNEAQVKEFSPMVGETVDLSVKVESRKESLSLKVALA